MQLYALFALLPILTQAVPLNLGGLPVISLPSAGTGGTSGTPSVPVVGAVVDATAGLGVDINLGSTTGSTPDGGWTCTGHACPSTGTGGSPVITVPDVKVPEVTVPEVKVPDVTVPDVKLPDVTVPDIKVPDVTVPDVNLPDVTLPDIKLPDVTLPDIKVPDVTLPNVNLPDITLPDIKVPDVKVPDVTVPEVPTPSVPVPDVGHPTVPSTGASLPDLDLEDVKDTVGEILEPITSGKPATVISDLTNYISGCGTPNLLQAVVQLGKIVAGLEVCLSNQITTIKDQAVLLGIFKNLADLLNKLAAYLKALPKSVASAGTCKPLISAIDAKLVSYLQGLLKLGLSAEKCRGYLVDAGVNIGNLASCLPKTCAVIGVNASVNA